MKKKVWNVLAACAAVGSAIACVAAALSGGCPTLVETGGGGSMHMVCYWTFHAVALFELVAAFAAAGLLKVKCKVGRRWLATTTILLQLCCDTLMFTPVMGICSGGAMRCHSTATVVAICTAIVIALCLVVAVKADPHRQS